MARLLSATNTRTRSGSHRERGAIICRAARSIAGDVAFSPCSRSLKGSTRSKAAILRWRPPATRSRQACSWASAIRGLYEMRVPRPSWGEVDLPGFDVCSAPTLNHIVGLEDLFTDRGADRDQRAEQNPRRLQGRPSGAIQHATIIPAVSTIALSRHRHGKSDRRLRACLLTGLENSDRDAATRGNSSAGSVGTRKTRLGEDVFLSLRRLPFLFLKTLHG